MSFGEESIQKIILPVDFFRFQVRLTLNTKYTLTLTGSLRYVTNITSLSFYVGVCWRGCRRTIGISVGGIKIILTRTSSNL